MKGGVTMWYTRIENYMKQWKQYDRDTFNDIMLMAESRGLLRRRGQDIGNLFYHSKTKRDEIEYFYEVMREQFGTVTQEKQRRADEYRDYKDNTNNELNVHSKEEYHEIKTKINDLWSTLYYTFNPSDVHTLYVSVKNESEHYQLKAISKFIGEHEELEQAIFRVSYKEVKKMWRE